MIVCSKDWSKVKKFIPEERATEIEYGALASTFKGKRITVRVAIKGGMIDAPGEEISEFWSIAPVYLGDGRFHKTRRSLTHTPSGLAAVRLRNRKAVVTLWQTVKDMDIHHKNANKIDYGKFKTACRSSIT